MADDKNATHGDFTLVSILASDLKETVREASYRPGTDNPPELRLEYTTRAALEQILVRIARIVYGDENHRKHWEDIQGFCRVKLDSIPAPTTELEHGIRDLIRRLPAGAAKANDGVLEYREKTSAT
jgi:hypothetical protein